MGCGVRKVIPLGLCLLAIGGPVLAGACAEDQLDLRGDWGQARFSVEIADDAVERGQGLMFRDSLGRGAGMLFVYETPKPASFWMKNTLIPLDMIFADAAGRVSRIHADAIPQDTTPIDGGPDVQYVLEINGGMAALLGINEGSEIRNPAIGPNAAWPCDEVEN